MRYRFLREIDEVRALYTYVSAPNGHSILSRRASSERSRMPCNLHRVMMSLQLGLRALKNALVYLVITMLYWVSGLHVNDTPSHSRREKNDDAGCPHARKALFEDLNQQVCYSNNC